MPGRKPALYKHCTSVDTGGMKGRVTAETELLQKSKDYWGLTRIIIVQPSYRKVFYIGVVSMVFTVLIPLNLYEMETAIHCAPHRPRRAAYAAPRSPLASPPSVSAATAAASVTPPGSPPVLSMPNPPGASPSVGPASASSISSSADSESDFLSNSSVCVRDPPLATSTPGLDDYELPADDGDAPLSSDDPDEPVPSSSVKRDGGSLTHYAREDNCSVC